MLKRLVVLLAAAGGLISHANAQTYGLPTNDTSSSAGNGITKWNPLFFGMPGTGNVWRMNRIFCGEATGSSGDAGPVTSKDWLENLIPNTTGVAQLACIDAAGQLGLLGASRASDFRTIFGSSSGGVEGNTGIAYNDDTSGGAIAVGTVGIGVAKVGAVGITLGAQQDINSALASVLDITPFTGVTSGTTVGNLITSGAYAGIGTANISAGLVFNLGRGGGPVFRKAIVCESNVLDATVGAGGDGVCAEMARNQSVRWMNSGGGIDGEITANASGIQFPTDQAWTAFTATPTCGTATITTNSAKRKTLGKSTFVELDMTITAVGSCTNQFTFTLPNTANSGAGLAGRQTAGNGGIVGCFLLSGSATATCATSNTYSANQVVLSGVYENQ